MASPSSGIIPVHVYIPYSRGLTPRAFKLGKVLEWGVGVNPGGGGGGVEGASKGWGGGGVFNSISRRNLPQCHEISQKC